jgi:hypothetical protein
MTPLNFGLNKSDNPINGFAISQDEVEDKIFITGELAFFDTDTHRVYVMFESSTMTVTGNPKMSYWSGGSGGNGTSRCVGHSGSGGGGSGGCVQVTDDTFFPTSGVWNVVIPGRGGGSTYLEDPAGVRYAEAHRGGGGVFNGTGGAGGTGGGGGSQ